MQEVVSSVGLKPSGRLLRITSRARLEAPSRMEWVSAAFSTSFLILSFPNFESYLLAWISLVPLLVAIAHRPRPGRALILGWATGTVFFYVSCYWLTYSMIHYGGIPTVLAYLLLIPGAVVIGIFPGLFALLLAMAIRRWGHSALFLAPIFWVALEWARLAVTGQLWNAIGYSQAFNPSLIQAATWGGVYAVSFLILAINCAIALLVINRSRWAITAALTTVLFVGIAIVASPMEERGLYSGDSSPVSVVALQPNVPMNFEKSMAETRELRERHLSLSTYALKTIKEDYPKLVVWPESPMNFTYSSDTTFQELVANFTRDNHTFLLFNSLEPAPEGGYNSALLINEEGRRISRYDKIRLMPFGEYVPLPRWLPGASLITGIVGEFTPGGTYTVMPIRDRRVGVFICIESAYPYIARSLVNEGADSLINISNDGYLGPTAVMRQHLANAIFRAVENSTPMLRVTNSGLSAQISYDGTVMDQTGGFVTDVRVWPLRQTKTSRTFYTKYGDVFVYLCGAITLAAVVAMLLTTRRSFRDLK